MTTVRHPSRLGRRGFALGSAAIAFARSVQAQAVPPAVVFAAASLTDALSALGAEWTARTGQDVRFVFAASSTLARQIEQGAQADIFASADMVWMDDVQHQGLIDDASRVSPIGNTLVLIAPRGTAQPVALTRGTDLLALLGPDGRLATGDPAHVPVGLYAHQALSWMGQWDAVAPRIARADSVRAALLLVERAEAPYGIVYGTDAAVSKGVAVVGTFPPESHDPVRYPFAVLRRSAGDVSVRALFRFLTGPEAAVTYRRLGFAVAPD